ncbi:MAG: trypsin-like peptidase domain-containing protein [Candidatus Eutrophobiaceae bacterium]
MKSISNVLIGCFSSLILGLLPLMPAYAGLPNFADLAEKYVPTVVNINARGTSSNSSSSIDLQELFNDRLPLREFMEEFSQFDKKAPNNAESHWLGSGFIVSADGYIITSHSVLQEAKDIIVRMSDRREFIATMVGVDEDTDIAVLKIDVQDVPFLEMGNSTTLRAGQWVLAIGSLADFEYTVTSGIISALNRFLPQERRIPFIQTDAAMNAGNSGGPLLNEDGKLIGINTQLSSPTNSRFAGMAFAVPVHVVEYVYGQLRDTGFVNRGWLGVQVQNVTAELAESFQMKTPRGALVAKVVEGSPAEQAGLMEGDILLSFNGNQLFLHSDLPPLVGLVSLGSKVELEILRKGVQQVVDVTIAPRSDKAAIDGLGAQNTVLLGMELEDEEDGGVLVRKVIAEYIRNAGIKNNDIIAQINGITLRDKAHLAEIAEDLPRDRPVSVLINRKAGGSLFLVLNLP